MIRQQEGDTIVEVLIALVIATVVLVGAFAISNMCLKQIRMAHERSEAQKIAEGAVESLNAMYQKNPTIANRVATNPDANERQFCKDPASYNALSTKAYDDGPTNCMSGITGMYHVAIVSEAASGKTFNVTVTWPGLTGTDQHISIIYRVKDPV